MHPNAVLGSVDLQIGEFPAASIVKVLEVKRQASSVTPKDKAAELRVDIERRPAERTIFQSPSTGPARCGS
jgi:hypothetical protein